MSTQVTTLGFECSVKLGEAARNDTAVNCFTLMPPTELVAITLTSKCNCIPGPFPT